MRNLLLAALTALTLAVGAFPAVAADNAAAQGQVTEYVVLFAEDASTDAARAAVEAAGGTVVRENTAIGVATVASDNASFVGDASAQGAIDGVAANRPIGFAPQPGQVRADDIERLDAERATIRPAQVAPPARPVSEPLGYLQWDMQMINATPGGSYSRQQGNRRVLVGILDTGIDGSHPDLRPNFDAALSRNFTTDIPEIDGPCEEEPDQSCEDPADVDEYGHGTHVAGSVAAPINGLGIAGVAPNVTLVNIRAAQDSGYFFLAQTLDAFTYAADVGIDVLNMSFYTDPWLFNCPNNPRDTPEQQQEQRTIIEATNRALNYAHQRNVTLVGALGNSFTDLGNPMIDATSPDYPPGAAYRREIDNTCLTMPAEGDHVIGVTSVGPSERKSYFSNYSPEQADLAAPGGDINDFPGTSRYRTVQNLVLSPYPLSVAIRNREVDPNTGLPTSLMVVRDCRGSVCGYYRYQQGTSMAAPHAAGVAALIVSQYGRPQLGGRWTMDPDAVERILKRSARDHACPEPRLQTYIVGATPVYNPIYNATCEGGPDFNGFYGEGIVDALRAVTYRGF